MDPAQRADRVLPDRFENGRFTRTRLIIRYLTASAECTPQQGIVKPSISLNSKLFPSNFFFKMLPLDAAPKSCLSRLMVYRLYGILVYNIVERFRHSDGTRGASSNVSIRLKLRELEASQKMITSGGLVSKSPKWHREANDDTYEFGHEGNHEVEQTNGLDESKAENGVREELEAHAGIAGNASDECREYKADADTCASKTNSGRAHTQVPGNLHHSLGDLGRVQPSALKLIDGVAGDGGGLLALE